MTRYAIDPATLVHLAETERPVHPGHQLVAANSIRTLALDSLLARVRRGELDEARAMALHERMTATKMRLLGDRVSRRTAWQLATEHGLASVGDAECIAVAQLQADALVAMDPQLAARAAGLVPLAAVAALHRP